VIMLDGFRHPDEFKSLQHSVFLSFTDLLPDVYPEAGKEQLMLEELGHVIESFIIHSSEVKAKFLQCGNSRLRTPL